MTLAMPNSLWAATTARPEPWPLLQGKIDADVCVVGGGFMGLSVALSLAQRGVNVAVVEAAEIGWGASGRNNGLVASGLKRDPWEVRKLLGEERGNRLLRYSGDAPNSVFELIAEHGIDCDMNRGGWVQAAHSRRALRGVERRVREWSALGVDVEMIEPGDVDEQLGTSFYAGACRYESGGSINPLAYAHGIAQAASSAGARLFEQSPALRMERHGNQWIVASNYGVVAAEYLLCCTNAYNHDIERLHGTVIPLRTAQVASHRLPQQVAAKILPNAAAASDTQRLLTSFRLTADNRLIMGGASATAGDEHPRLIKRLHRAARDRFPALDSIPWEYGWSGYMALTANHLPQIAKIDDRFLAPVGCNGRGIAMTTAMGRTLADLVGGMDEEKSDVPVEPARRIFGFGLRHPGVVLGVAGNRLLDRLGRLT